MKPRLHVSTLGVLLALATACSARDDEPLDDTTAADESALADCSTDLGNCYTACQGETPTPRAECFTACDRVFYKCIDAPAAELAQ